MILWADHVHPEWADHYRAHGTTRTVTTLPAPACPNLPDCEVSWEPVNAYGLGPDVKERVCLTHDSHPGGSGPGQQAEGQASSERG